MDITAPAKFVVQIIKLQSLAARAKIEHIPGMTFDLLCLPCCDVLVVAVTLQFQAVRDQPFQRSGYPHSLIELPLAGQDKMRWRMGLPKRRIRNTGEEIDQPLPNRRGETYFIQLWKPVWN